MTDASVHQLEREVEASRAKLAGDLAILRSPDTFSEFTDGLKHEALDAKDALIEKATSSARSAVDEIVENLKARAAANPGAVLAIGAGIAWRLVRHPPIATALVGAGLYSLLRTTPMQTNGYGEPDYLSHAKARLREQASDVAETVADQAMQAAGAVKDQAMQTAGMVRDQAKHVAGTMRDQAAELADNAREKVHDWSAEAKSAARSATFELKDQTASMTRQASDTLADVRRTSGDVASMATAQASRMVEQASSQVQGAVNDPNVRNAFLLGVAGLAVAAALGSAYQRRAREEAEVD